MQTLEALEFSEKRDVGAVEERRYVELESTLPNDVKPA
jgi:hypothetical protein